MWIQCTNVWNLQAAPECIIQSAWLGFLCPGCLHFTFLARQCESVVGWSRDAEVAEEVGGFRWWDLLKLRHREDSELYWVMFYWQWHQLLFFLPVFARNCEGTFYYDEGDVSFLYKIRYPFSAVTWGGYKLYKPPGVCNFWIKHETPMEASPPPLPSLFLRRSSTPAFQTVVLTCW